MDVSFDANRPTVLVGLCPVFPVTITRSWSDTDSQIQVSDPGGGGGGSLALPWDYAALDRSWIESEEVMCMLLVCGLNQGANGPVGLLVASRHGHITSRERPCKRVGLVDGFRKQTALRRWSSCGWETHDGECVEDEIDAKGDGETFNWVEELRKRPRIKVYIQ